MRTIRALSSDCSSLPSPAAWLTQLHTASDDAKATISALSRFNHLRCLSITLAVRRTALSTEECTQAMEALAASILRPCIRSPSSSQVIRNRLSCRLLPSSRSHAVARFFAFLYQSHRRCEMIPEDQRDDLRGWSLLEATGDRRSTAAFNRRMYRFHTLLQLPSPPSLLKRPDAYARFFTCACCSRALLSDRSNLG